MKRIKLKLLLITRISEEKSLLLNYLQLLKKFKNKSWNKNILSD